MVVVVAEDFAFVVRSCRRWVLRRGRGCGRGRLRWLLVFAGVRVEERGGDGGGVDEGVVEDGSGFVDGAAGGGSVPACWRIFFDVLGGGEADGLIGLGHEVADVDAGGFGFGEGFWGCRGPRRLVMREV